MNFAVAVFFKENLCSYVLVQKTSGCIIKQFDCNAFVPLIIFNRTKKAMPSSDTRVITFVYSCALTHKATKELHKVLVNVTGESERKRVQDDEKQ